MEDAGYIGGCDVPTAASGARVVGGESVRVHGDLQAFGSRPGRKATGGLGLGSPGGGSGRD